jgi:predicted DsbA family dithiol-disulfide isomerase
MPKDGIERSKYLEIKFGGKKNAQPMYDRMTEEAKKEGLEFNLDKIKKTPNTVSSHILINLSKKYNTQTKILENLYQSYFIKSLDIGNENILANIGKENGINENQIRSAFNSRENIDQVNSYNQIARQKVINGVPFFEIGKNFISGAQSVTNLEKTIQSNF